MSRMSVTEAGGAYFGVIYKLMDPRSGATTYIGATIKSLEERLGGHISTAKRNVGRPISVWINELAEKNLKPVIEIIEETRSENHYDREVYWINAMRKDGVRLLNVTIGGKTMVGYTHSELAKKKIADCHKGKVISIEQKRLLSLAMTGRKLSDERKEKMRLASTGRKHSQETRDAMSLAKKGKPAPSSVGERNGRATITLADARDIRGGVYTEHTAKQELGLSRTQYYRIKRGEQWQE